MKIEQLYTGCLAEMAYYIEDSGEAAIIDPLRETDPYIKMAKADGAKIKYIFLTHFHADFVAGHIDLARKTGATIVYGPNAKTEFDAYIAKDGEEFRIGNATIRVLHTPGHTMESTTYLLIDPEGKERAIFTGDTLFIGDVGRPDLAVKSGEITKEDLAGYLYESLRNKIMPLPDDIIVYPAHGAGSACGKNMSEQTWDTLGNQKKTNYALDPNLTKEEFIAKVIDGLLPPPKYFAINARMNRTVNTSIDEILERGTTPLSAETFRELSQRDDVLVIDTRSKSNYASKGTVPGAWWIGIEGNFAPWVGALVGDVQQKIIFITDDESRVQEIVTRFARVGFENILGYLAGGIENWIKHGYPVDKIGNISAVEFLHLLKEGKCPNPIDVRNPREYESQHIVGVENFPLDFIHENLHQLDPNKTYHIHCNSGYRSLIAASIMRTRGFNDVINVEGGFKALVELGAPTTQYVCPTTVESN